MNGRRLRSALLVGFGAVLLPLVCFAELPPLSPEEQESQATTIVTGKVKSLKHHTVPGGQPGFLDDDVTVSFQVEKVLKGKKIRPGQMIQVHYWQRKQRPRGWVGPGGQSEPLKVGARARLYLKKGKHPLDLLIPNGWAPVGKPQADGAPG